ncbi:MAG: GTPase HflX [Clostridia bacterium]|nr:GTPase HflX [Clostridia bacterium]
MQNKDKIAEKIYIIQPITRENAAKYQVLREEAIALIESADAVYAGTLYQNIHEINPATFIGEGKLAELSALLEGLGEITLLFNGELSPSQLLNISSAVGNRKVIDRTTLILDIFAKNAKSGEGKLQVELAQLKYLYPRLKGKGAELSRLGGGVGTRGPGETKLETDRRYIRGRLNYLENKLKNLEKRRHLQLERRKKENIKTIALVGYTNVGKSTLLNLLAGAETYVHDGLFATLDPTARNFTIHDVPFLLVYTVGFLQDLPHHLIEAFHSTLESALHCDLAIIVCDGQGEYQMQLDTTLQTLQELNFNAPYIVAINKCEGQDDFSDFPLGSIPISAKENKGIEGLKREIFKHFQQDFLFRRLQIPYSKTSEYAKIKKHIIERNVSYTDDGMEIDAVIPTSHADLFTSFV